MIIILNVRKIIFEDNLAKLWKVKLKLEHERKTKGVLHNLKKK
jgi:hypothetical protein